MGSRASKHWRAEWDFEENTVAIQMLSPEHRSELNTACGVPVSVTVCGRMQICRPKVKAGATNSASCLLGRKSKEQDLKLVNLHLIECKGKVLKF